MDCQIKITYGPPGTGKTTQMLADVEKELAKGVPPHKIGFFTFTKKASMEARERAVAKFPQYQAEDFANFMTLHAFAFRNIGATTTSVMRFSDYKKVSDMVGLETMGKHASMSSEDMLWMGTAEGDKAIFIENLARIRCESLKEAWDRSGAESLEWETMSKFKRVLDTYKSDNLLMDFTDMLQKFISRASIPNLPVVFIDEAQDLSLLQWELVKLLFHGADRAYVAGDDDQAIFRWAGADVDSFINLQGEAQVLDQSYRIPTKVHELAKWLKQGIRGGVQKTWKPRAEVGKVEWITTPDIPELEKGNWLLLARNNYNLKEYNTLCEDAGYSFESPTSPLRGALLTGIIMWERLRKGKALTGGDCMKAYDLMSAGKGYRKGNKALLASAKNALLTMKDLKERFGLLKDGIWHECLDLIEDSEKSYFIRTLKRGEKVTGIPRIRISTIHGAKGGEADNVMINPVMSPKNLKTPDFSDSDEYRVWYVGITRAKQSLHILHPVGNYFFDPLSQAHLL